MNLVFIYGSLKKGKTNHNFMFKSKFVKNTYIKGFLYIKKSNDIFEIRDYPHLILSQSGNNIQGELYKVSDRALKFLDKFEGHPCFFKRVETLTIENENVFVYEYQLQENENLSDFKEIKNF